MENCKINTCSEEKNTVSTANKQQITMLGSIILEIQILNNIVDHKFYVSDKTDSGLAIIGTDFLKTHKCIIIFQKLELSVNSPNNKLNLNKIQQTNAEINYIMSDRDLNFNTLKKENEVSLNDNCQLKLSEFDHRNKIWAVTNNTQSKTIRLKLPKERDLIKEFNLHQSDLNDMQRAQLVKLLTEFSDVCSQGGHDLGRTNIINFTIETGDHPPIKQQLRRTNPIQTKQIEEMVQKMLDQGVIKESKSPWCSPVLLIEKKIDAIDKQNGIKPSVRFCLDYRKLNNCTKAPESWPLPRVDDTLDFLQGSQYYNCIDLVAGYWQL